ICGLSTESSPMANLQKVAYKLKELVESEPHLNATNCYTSFNLTCNSNMDRLVNSLLWHKVYAKLNSKVKSVPETAMKKSLNELLLRTATSARKSLNFKLAQNLLLQFAGSNFEVKVSQEETLAKSGLLSVFEESLNKPVCADLIKFFMEI